MKPSTWTRRQQPALRNAYRLLLAGSSVGIADSYTDGNPDPGIVFPPNLTADPDTGLGIWTKSQIVAAISAGQNHRGDQLSPVMPWSNYALLRERDLNAIATYLMSLPATKKQIPDAVAPGTRSPYGYVRFGVYLFAPGEQFERALLPGTPDGQR
ncbi:MAG: hypothetical protein AAF648_12235 [Pseudomonadota bacterium]